jgi:hypothetical protein
MERILIPFWWLELLYCYTFFYKLIYFEKKPWATSQNIIDIVDSNLEKSGKRKIIASIR